jgi:hypothetical protein
LPKLQELTSLRKDHVVALRDLVVALRHLVFAPCDFPRDFISQIRLEFSYPFL